MIVITGDTHRNFNKVVEFTKRFNTTTDDIMIILGDIGINYNLNESDKKIKELLNLLPITLFCIQGNHEKRPDDLANYHLKDFLGGKVYVEDDYPNLIFAKDGEIYDFDGKKAIVIGGVYSVDKSTRLLYKYPWFEDEQPSQETKDYVIKQLKSIDWKLDYVLTHTVPYKFIPRHMFLDSIDQSTVDNSTEIFLDEIEDNLEYEKWYAGHYHTDEVIDKLTILFNGIQELR